MSADPVKCTDAVITHFQIKTDLPIEGDNVIVVDSSDESSNVSRKSTKECELDSMSRKIHVTKELLDCDSVPALTQRSSHAADNDQIASSSSETLPRKMPDSGSLKRKGADVMQTAVCEPVPKKFKKRIKKAQTDVVGLFMDLQRQQEYPREYNTNLPHFHLNLEIGDEVLNYFIIRKAGYGHSSIVWLCFDKNVRKFSALKVMKHGVAYARELKMLTTVREHGNKPGSDKVVMLLNAFPFGSPMHYVMVFEPLGMSLLALMQRSHSGFEIPVVKKLLKHTLEGLHFLHTDIGCIHSDIKPENIMISVSERSFYLETQKVVERKYNGLGMRASNAPKGRLILSKTSKDYFQVILGLCPESSEEPLNQYEMPNDGSPAQFLRYRHLLQRRAVATELLNPSTVFKIGDLGNAMQIDTYPGNLATFEYRPPENIFLMELSGTFDVWGIAATALETVLQDIIFRPIDDEREQNNCKLYQRMLDILGDYDGSAFADTPAYQEMETELRPSEAIHQSTVDNIRQHLLTYGFKYDEIDELSKLLSCLLVFDGKKRFTAAQALSHNFFAD